MHLHLMKELVEWDLQVNKMNLMLSVVAETELGFTENTSLVSIDDVEVFKKFLVNSEENGFDKDNWPNMADWPETVDAYYDL